MRILVTNDDGIHSPGLAVAEKIARAFSDDVWVVAPENEQSGASHSLTLTSPLRLRQMDEQRFAVSGTPTDCVMMACLHILKDQAARPDPVGRQLGLQPGRRRHLFRHHRRRHGRLRAGHSLHRLVAML